MSKTVPQSGVHHAQVVRLSNLTRWSVAAGIIASIVHFFVSLAAVSYIDHPGFVWVPITIFGPFAALVIVGTIAHRLRYTFDARAGTLNIEARVFGIRRHAPITVPLTEVGRLQLKEDYNGEDFIGRLQFAARGYGICKVTGRLAVLKEKRTRQAALVWRHRGR